MFGIDKLLFDKFSQMPAWVRVLTYLVLLTVFIYLVLLPRFVDGQLVVRDPSSGGLLPYRGADLQVHVDGRSYKFRSNEEGYFSIPIIGRLPEAIEVKVLHVDRGFWFPIRFSVTELWTKKNHSIEILDDKPFVRLVGSETARSFVEPGNQPLLAWLLPSAHAQVLHLPPSLRPAATELPAPERERIQNEVEQTYAKVSGKSQANVQPGARLTGSEGLGYTQRIQLITAVERKFNLKIEDEHWQAMTSVEQLSDYVVKRKQIEQAAPADVRSKPWAQIQQSFPVEQAPVYRR